MPYTWSVNNVVMGENVHTALGFWQAGRADEAFRLMKSALLASMFMGICPGNVGSMNDLDVYRRESQRDFADGSGVLVARARRRTVRRQARRAGRQADQSNRASRRRGTAPACEHPDMTIVYRRQGVTEAYTIESRFAAPMTLTLRVAGAAGARSHR